MATLKEIRQAFPEYASVPDDVLSEALYKKYGGDTEKADFFLELQGRGPRISPIRSGIEGFKGSIETAIARGAQAVGAEETAQEYLRSAQEREEDVAARYQPVTRSFEDVKDPYTFYRYLLERGGESAPQMAAQIGGGIAGLGLRGAARLAGLALARGVSPTAAAAAGSTAVGTGAFTGYNIQRQMEEGIPFEETSLGAAGATALGQSALDTLSLATILRGFPGLTAAGAGTRVAAATRRAIESGVTGALTESGQQALEILQANPEKLFTFSPEVLAELKEAAIAGGLLEGALGGVSGAATFRRPAAPAAETPAAETPVAEQVPAEQQVAEVPAEAGATIETAGAPAVAETSVAETPAAVEPPPMAPAPRIEAEPAAVEPGATVEPVTTEPAPAPTVQGPEPAAVEPVAGTPAATTPVEPVTTAPEPAAAPEPEKVAAMPALELFTSPTPPALPKSLQLGKPTFKFGKEAAFDLKFESGIERALFHATKKAPNEKDPQYVRWLKDQGLTDTQIKDLGKEFRLKLRGLVDERMATGATKGELFVPRFVPAAVQQAPAPAPVGTVPTPAPPPAQPAPAAAEPTAVAPPVPPATEPAAAAQPAEPAAVEPPPTVQEPPAPPPAQTAPFVQEPSKIQISKPFAAEIEQIIPGIGGVVREIQQNLFPGTNLRVVKAPYKSRFYGQSTVKFIGGVSTGDMVLSVNLDRIREDARNPDKLKADLLYTIFHELAHPIEYFYVANAKPEEITAVLQQYVRDRNPDSMQRSLLVKDLSDLYKGGDLQSVVDTMLKATGLTRQQYDKFLASQDKIVTDPDIRKLEFGKRYQRSFSEWSAEKGAKFFTKNLDQLVPKTVFENFQKNILELLRDLYSRIAKFLGMPDTEGAFEQLIKDRYGKVKKTPQASIANIQRLAKSPEYISSGSKKIATGQDVVSLTARSAIPGESAVDLDVARKKIFADVPETRGRFRRFVDTVSEMYKQGGWRALAEGLAREASDKYAPLMNLDKRFVDFMKAQGNEVAAGYDQTLPIAARLSSYVSMLDRETTLAKLNTLLFQGGLPVYWTKDGDPANLEGAIKIEGTGGGLSFIPELQKAGKLMNFAEYGVAKRALGTYAARKLEFQLSPAEAQAIVDLYEKDPAIVRAYKQYQEFNKALMDLVVAAGRITKKDAKRYLQYADFFPFHRFADQEGRLSGPINTRGVFDPGKIMKAKGGTELLQGDPVDMILKNAQFWLSSAQKNIAARKVYTMSEAIGEARQLSFTDVEKEQLADALYNGDMKEAGRHIQRERMLRPGEAEGSYYVNGVERRVALKHPDVVEALLATEAPMPDLFKGVFGTFTQGYRELVTRSPEFILSNLIRDSLGMPITSRVGFNILRPVQMMYQYMKNKENNKTILALMQWGAIGGYKTIPGLDNASKLLNPNFNPTKGGVYVPESGKVLTDILAKVWNTLGELSDASDAAPRAAIYEKVLEATGDEAEAAFRAQNAINYRKQGRNQLLRYLVVMVPFLNGRIQGLDVTARAFGSKEALIHTGIRGGYLLGAAMALQALVGDDEEYLQLPEYVRYGSLPVPLKLLGLGDSGFLAIPKPHELGFIFQTVPEVIYQAMLGNVETRNIARLTAEQLGSTFGLSITPQVISPLVETFITNRSNLTGLPIVTEAMKNLPNELQYSSATSQIVKDVAAATGISPVQAEALIKGYTGQIGTTVFGLMDSMYRSATGRGVDKNWTQYPIVQKFLKDSSNTNPQGVADVYRLSGEIQGLTTALNTFLAQGSMDKATALIENNSGLFNIKPTVAQLRTQLNTLSRNERMIVNNPNIPQEQKKEQLRQIREYRRAIGKMMTENISQTGK